MYTAQPKKLLIMNILEILQRYTDEDHRLSQREIGEILEREYSVRADRKTIKRNLTDLIDAGYDLEYSESIRKNRQGEDEVLLRSCLVSIQKQTNKSERKHLKRVLQFALAVFPKSATFIDPSKRALDNPAFWQNSKGVEFTAFNDLNICARKSVDGVGKIFSGVTSIHQNLLEHRQMIRYITIIVNHVDCSVPVGHIGSCYHDHVGQP